ncbi:DUF169 domain-containing protein [Dethiosulfatarculus sandiegensis]|uniref:Uncharacterized protein n=1 Tax=Dethiosulfatarculus sandiegensis TaxID=1429043 RepID=A0A0D2GL27_9BACT|nr:DUF169 domain-containing protein [Dethiosulfatarculus sandiegensis]KIX15422.1 hypothetical protein X474_03705 [Dethiosulfatarculus sandiegensis]
MKAKIVKDRLYNLSEVLSFKYPATGWYFAADNIENSFIFKKDRWVCMFMYWAIVIKKGKRIQFSADNGKACPGIQEFGGFVPPADDKGKFIAETERFKKSCTLAQAYYRDYVAEIHTPPEKFLYFEKIETIHENKEIEVVNLFPDITGLANLAGLASYDREKSGTLIPDASACQSAFSTPYDQKFKKQPKCIVGLMDVLARHFVPDDMIMFSAPANRFVEMVNNIEGSFLDKNFKNPTSF